MFIFRKNAYIFCLSKGSPGRWCKRVANCQAKFSFPSSTSWSPGHRRSHRRRVHNLRGTDLSINRQATIERTRRAKKANSKREIYCARVSFPSSRGCCCFRCAVVLPSSSSMLHLPDNINICQTSGGQQQRKKVISPVPNGLPGPNSQHERLAAAYGTQKNSSPERTAAQHTHSRAPEK